MNDKLKKKWAVLKWEISNAFQNGVEWFSRQHFVLKALIVTFGFCILLTLNHVFTQ